MLRVLAHLVGLLCVSTAAIAQDVAGFEEITVPVGPKAQEPSLFSTDDGRLLMSWTEASGNGFAVKMAILENGTWGPPRTITTSGNLFVNWADFPSVAAFADGTLLAHWLQKTGRSEYAYDVNIAFSVDDGETWGASMVPHPDGTETQNGFVTLVPTDDRMVAIWLDGRASESDVAEEGAIPGATQLRAAVLSSDGKASPDMALDYMACSCCHTAAALAGGDLIVVYRDRTEADIRDISAVRMSNGVWSDPISVHDDNWEISGCPVNGPSIAARDNRVLVAWLTGADDVPAVRIATSADGGRSFGDAVRIDRGSPVGRVDTLMLEDGSGLVSWVEWTGNDETLLLCRLGADGCLSTWEVAVNSSTGSMNFPQIAATSEGFYIAWTHPLPDGGDTIRMLRMPR